MSKFLRLAEGLVGKLIGEAEAGACVPQNGMCCYEPNRIHNCYGNCVTFSGC